MFNDKLIGKLKFLFWIIQFTYIPMMNKIKNDLTFVTSLAVTFKHLIVQHQAGAPIYYFGHKMPFSKKTKKRGGKKKEGEKKTYF